MTSDEFFVQNKETFDVIFIDGLHHADQVHKDIINSLDVLNEDGYIVCHDLNPISEKHQIIPFAGGEWNGDCWKAFVNLRKERSDLEMYTVDTDQGCGIITRGSQKLLEIKNDLTYSEFDVNRKEWLNLISPEQFMLKFNVEEDSEISQLILDYALDSENPETNFSLGLHYDEIGQTASALSYYLRCAERTDDDLVKYECLIRGSMCFDKQGTRNFTVKGMLQHAIAVLPKRPEAYYLLSRFYEREERDGHWIDAYMIASIGEKVCVFDRPSLRTNVDYPGDYAILYQKAVVSWWCGLCDESRDLFRDLYENYELDEYYKKSVFENLTKLNGFKQEEPFAIFSKDKFDSLKIKFPGSENIERNYSEAYQDMFVLTMLNGKKEGTYLEIGAGNAFYGNNTALLEKDFGWKGVALDICEEFVNAHNAERKNPCLLKNALSTNYEMLLSGMDFPNNIDYLQLDCDPPEATYKILLNIPFEKYKFAVITYEHDYYCDESKSFQEKSRKYLESYGYVRVVNNISPDNFRPYEDWWVHPDLVDSSMISNMMCISDETKKAEDYILFSNSEEPKEKEFDWGLIEKNAWFRKTLEKEIFIDDIYQKFFGVDNGDVVFDVGASIGPFTYSILNKNPSKVYCFEPHEDLYKTLVKNVSSENVVCVNKSVGSSDDGYTTKGLFNEDIVECFSDLNEKTVPSTKFSTFIRENNIEKIDFLKSDCEGGEYEIFNEENFEWIKNNVKKIAGEWHLVTEEQKVLFRKFRDTYLKEMPNHQVFSIDDIDIKHSLWSDWFIDYYGLITLYIDNSN